MRTVHPLETHASYACEIPFIHSLTNRHAQEASGAAAGSSLDSDWELEPSDVMFHEKIASGAFGDLYRGSYCGQDVAIKILRAVQGTAAQFSEFLQEIAIMRKVRHKNVVQFIGACTKKPNLCIVFEYMQRGSVYEYIRKVRVWGVGLWGGEGRRERGWRFGLVHPGRVSQRACGLKGRMPAPGSPASSPLRARAWAHHPLILLPCLNPQKSN